MGIVIILTILTILVLSTLAYVVRRLWLYLRCRRTGNAEEKNGRKDSNWARKNSNVLWSIYPDEDDLRRQFSRPSKCSRMFSIGSVSTLGPLDKVAEAERKPSVDGCDALKHRAGYEPEGTPTKTLPRRNTAPNVQHHNDSSAEDKIKKIQFIAGTPPSLQELLDSSILGRQASVA